jgi:hypothetical protein
LVCSAILNQLPASSSGFDDFLEGVRMAPARFDRPLRHLLRGEILTRWPQLTSEEVENSGTDRLKLAGLLQIRYGYAQRRAEKEVDLFFGEFQNRLRMAA